MLALTKPGLKIVVEGAAGEGANTEDEDFRDQGAHTLGGRQRTGTKAYHRFERAVIRQF
jgi:alanine dehydrogenase